VFAGPRARQFVTTGICGGYTTFSGFALETVRFLQASDIGSAALYIALSVVSWLLAVWAGEALAGWINDLKGGP
jgi:CrcB protein